MTAKRYNFDIPNSSYEEICDNGDYVSSEDYDNLLVDLKDLQVKYDKLVEKLGDLYREA